MKMGNDFRIYEEYHPESAFPIAEIKRQLALFRKNNPKADFKQIFSKRKKVWDALKRKKYPKVDVSKFHEVENANGKVGIYFNAWKILDEDGKSDNFDDFSNPEMKKELMVALGPKNTWPDAFLATSKKYPIPASDFNVKGKDLPDIPTDIKIYVSQNEHFLGKFRKLGGYGTIHFSSAKQAHAWLKEPIFSYWSQQLNFAVWCATSGCGIPNVSEVENLNPIIVSFLRFHVYFTIRRILYELSCPLPGDKAFKKWNNYYKKDRLEKLTNEFSLPNNPDFR